MTLHAVLTSQDIGASAGSSRTKITPVSCAVENGGDFLRGRLAGLQRRLMAQEPNSCSHRLPVPHTSKITSSPRSPASRLVPCDRAALLTAQFRRIVAFADKSRLPAIYPYRCYVDAGRLMSYGVDRVDGFRQAARFVDASSRAHDRPICRSSSLPNLSWSST